MLRLMTIAAKIGSRQSSPRKIRNATREPFDAYPSASGGSFFLRIDRLGVLAGMARPRADVREAEQLEKLANRALVIGDAEALLNDALQIDPSPADDTIPFSIRPGLDNLGEGHQLFWPQPERMVFGTNILEPLRALSIEAANLVPQHLSIDPCRLSAPPSARPVPSNAPANDNSRRFCWRPSNRQQDAEAQQPNNPS
jgi:hypothetical protein